MGSGEITSGISLGRSHHASWPVHLAVAASQRQPARYGFRCSCLTVRSHASHCMSMHFCKSCRRAKWGLYTRDTLRTHCMQGPALRSAEKPAPGKSVLKRPGDAAPGSHAALLPPGIQRPQAAGPSRTNYGGTAVPPLGLQGSWEAQQLQSPPASPRLDSGNNSFSAAPLLSGAPRSQSFNSDLSSPRIRAQMQAAAYSQQLRQSTTYTDASGRHHSFGGVPGLTPPSAQGRAQSRFAED